MNKTKWAVKAEVFYNVDYGSSIMISKISSNNLSNENKNYFVVVFKTKHESKCKMN